MINSNSEPLYLQIAADFRKKVQLNIWAQGTKIPTEIELCDEYHVSRITIRKAIDELIKDNLIIRKKALGTFIKEYTHTVDDHFTVVKSFTKEMKEVGIDIKTMKVTILEGFADQRISNFLKIPIGEKIIILKRLRGEKNKAFAYFITYIQYDEKFSLKQSTYKGSFYEYLLSLGIYLTSDQEIVEAILPNKEVATMLRISQNKPVLKRVRMCSDPKTNFHEYTECYYTGSEYKYRLDFSSDV